MTSSGGTIDAALAFVLRVRQAAAAFGSRKVRTPQGRMLGNSQAGRPDGKCNREQTADGADPSGPLAEPSVRQRNQGSRTGKGETVV